jgi:hypothetical protein
MNTDLTTWRALRDRRAALRVELQAAAALAARGTAYAKERAALLLHAHDALTDSMRDTAGAVMETYQIARALPEQHAQAVLEDVRAALVELYGVEEARTFEAAVLERPELLERLLGAERLDAATRQQRAAQDVADGLEGAIKELQNFYSGSLFAEVRAMLAGKARPARPYEGRHWLRALCAWINGTGTRAELRDALNGKTSAASRQREKAWKYRNK